MLPPPGSIRARLLVGTSATLLAVLGLAAWVSYDGSMEEARELFDARLATSARVLEALVARQLENATVARPIVIALPAPLEAQSHDAPGPLGHYYETKIAFQLRESGGRLLARSASAPREPFAPLEPGFLTRPYGDRSWRVFTLRSGGVWVQVAEQDDVRNELAEKLALAAAVPLLAGIVILLVLLSLLIRYGLEPLSALARQVAAREPGSVTPLRVDRAPGEIAPLVEALNGLLSRVRFVLERERRFTADAAHELRTPLAALKIHAQNAARAASAGDRKSSIARVLEGIERTVHLTEQMLAYRRAVAPGDAERHVPVALHALLAGAVEAVRPLAQERAADVRLEAEPGACDAAVPGDGERLASLFVNLLDNALRYGPRGGRVRVELRREPGAATVAVVDEGPGIPRELRGRAFESYFRIAGTPGTGTGLGLAIVEEVAQAHHASVAIEDGPAGRGTSVVVRFPVLAAACGPS